MASQAKRHTEKASLLFKKYTAHLIFRLIVFIYAVYLYINKPHLLSPSEYFGPAHGFNSIDFFFLIMLFDVLTKFFPNAKIAMGSLKQYKEFHFPTMNTFKGGKDSFVAYVKKMVNNGLVAIDQTRIGFVQTAQQILSNVRAFTPIPFEDEHLTSTEKMRRSIRGRRTKEIVPVIIFWIVWNVALALLFDHFGILNEQTVVLWTLFYFLFDMICVVAWCPLQVFMMHNRCCTTCQIFNWDAIMASTPLLLIGGPFCWILIAFSLIVLVRWELAVVRYPERFDERTNASLMCVNCKDKLCYLRPPHEPNKKTPTPKLPESK